MRLAVVGEMESSVMDREARVRAENPVRFERLIRRHVDWTHEPFGLVGADGEQREAWGWEFLGDFAEMRAEAGVAAEINISVRRLDQPAAPECAVAIGERAAGEIHRDSFLLAGGSDGAG